MNIQPPTISVDAAAGKPRGRKGRWILWLGLAAPILIIACCTGLIMFSPNYEEASRQRQRDAQPLVQEAELAVQEVLQDSNATVEMFFYVNGTIGVSQEIVLTGKAHSVKISGPTGAEYTVTFAHDSSQPSGYEVRKASIFGRTKEYGPGEFKPGHRPAN